MAAAVPPNRPVVPAAARNCRQWAASAGSVGRPSLVPLSHYAPSVEAPRCERDHQNALDGQNYLDAARLLDPAGRDPEGLGPWWAGMMQAANQIVVPSGVTARQATAVLLARPLAALLRSCRAAQGSGPAGWPGPDPAGRPSAPRSRRRSRR